MRALILGFLLGALLASPSLSQDVTRYVGPDRKSTAVDDTHRLPVAGGVTGAAGAGLSSSVARSVSNSILVAGPLNFYGTTVSVATGQGGGWMMIWDATTVPADGTVAAFRCFYVPAGPISVTYGNGGAPITMLHGYAWAFSTGADCTTKVSATLTQVSISFKQ